MKKITVTVNGKIISAQSGEFLSEIIRGEKPCGGHGKCGKCKVIAKGELSQPSDAELSLLSQEELMQGFRLACLTQVLGNCEINTISDSADTHIVTEGIMPEFELKPAFSKYGVAIDIGTTTLAARLYDTNGKMLSEVSRLNPQTECGADVISRIEAALDGNEKTLADSIRNALSEIICEFDVPTKSIDGVVITGNTVMLSLLTEESVEPFSRAPFDVKRLFGETLTADGLALKGLKGDTPVYLPPCISAFVGADITCALLATELYKKDTAMLVDIGTNGEMALRHDGKLTVCSTAAGPAFEGVGISMGMRGKTGAIDKVMLTDGKLSVHVIGEAEPTGICGSGLIDAVACLIETGDIDETGFMEDDEITLASPVTITQKDIRMLQLAKSAICAGLLTLTDSKKLTSCDVLYIAGGFGNYLSKENAVKIGLLPANLSKASKNVGNAALTGASMLLLNTAFADTVRDLSKNADILDLSSNPTFSDHYVNKMTFGN